MQLSDIEKATEVGYLQNTLDSRIGTAEHDVFVVATGVIAQLNQHAQSGTVHIAGLAEIHFVAGSGGVCLVGITEGAIDIEGKVTTNTDDDTIRKLFSLDATHDGVLFFIGALSVFPFGWSASLPQRSVNCSGLS